MEGRTIFDLFISRAKEFEEFGLQLNLDDAIAKLVGVMSTSIGRLTNHEIEQLSDVGAILYLDWQARDINRTVMK